MKKFLLLSAAAVAMTASAGVMHTANFVTSFGEDQISNEPILVTAAVAPLKAPAVKADAQDVAGTYILATSNNYGSKHTNYNDKTQTAYEVVIEKDENGGYVVSNLMSNFTGKACPLAATFENGVLTIAPDQTMDTHTTYGKIVLANADDYSTTPIVRTPITFAMDEDGNLVQTSGSGLVRGIPEYSTGNYNLTPYHSKPCVLKKANATFEAFDYDDNAPVNYALCVEANEEGNGGVVYGIENGFVSYTVDAQGNVTFGQEGIAYSTNYGQGSNYGFGMGSLAPIVWDTDETTGASQWYYYTLASSPTGMPALEGFQIEEGDDVTIYTEPFAVFAYLSQYGGLRFSSYFAAADDKTLGATIKYSKDPVTAVNDLHVEKASKAVKMIENGQVVIVKDGVKFNVAGQAIK